MSTKYQILEAIGHGGMANVYRARDVDLEREVAIKELSPRLAEDERFVQLFLSEARKIASISHPNVLSIFAIEDDGQELPRLIVELAEGSLADQLRDGPCQPLLVRRIGRQVLVGLEAIHRGGLIHRDIKPGNILYSRGFYKIADFGVAAGDGEQTQPLATPRYMAPETLTRPHLVGPSSDLYSLGMTLYEALVGSARLEDAAVRQLEEGVSGVEGNESLQDAGKHLWHRFHLSASELPAPHRLDPEIPRDLSQWIARMVKKEMAERFETCREAITTLDRGGVDLEGAAGVEVTTAVGPRQQTEEPKRSRFYWLVALLLLVFVCGGMVLRTLGRTEVEIVSKPSGAEVYVNSELLGHTPMRRTLTLGSAVELRLAGFETYRASVESRAVETLGGRLSWRSMTIRSEPSGARVLRNGEEIGTTPFEMIGDGEEVSIVLVKDGFASVTLQVAPGDSPAPVGMVRTWPRLPEPGPSVDPEELGEALEGFQSPEPRSRLRIAGSSGAHLRFGDPLAFRARVEQFKYAAVFLLFSTGDAVLLYPNQAMDSLRLEPGSWVGIPLAYHATAGFRLQASEPSGRDLAFLLTSKNPLPTPPRGRSWGAWLQAYPLVSEGHLGSALDLARWATELRREEVDNTELVMVELFVESEQ